MALPVITTQVAFGSKPGAASYTWTTISTTGGIPSYVRSLSYQRGRQNELDKTVAGTGAALLGDATSLFDPRNTSSAFYPNVVPIAPIRATAVINSNSYNLFSHYVERWPRSSRVTNVWTERALTTVDGFELLNQPGLQGKVYAQENSGTRVTNVLNDAGWSSTLRTIGTGDSTVAAVTFAADDQTTSLEHLLEIADSEEGLLFVDGGGKLVFINRHALLLAPYLTSQATFSDNPGGSEIGYVALTPSYDKDHIWNEWRGSRQGSSTVITASDSTSGTQYLRRSNSFSSWVTTDGELLSQAQWKIAQTKNPLQRIESISVKPGNSTTVWDTLFGLELGERITVKETPPGFGSALSATYNIQRIVVDLTTDLADSTFTFGLWPSDINQYWLAATVGYSEAGTTTKAAY